tara:strand:+ start:1272 stop:2045 length:774 start_codon:yes stop_codon:yes gene_type:complete
MGTIKLLDGKIYDKNALLKKMDNDEFYYGELNKLALSSSSLKTLLASPKTYKFVQEYGSQESQALRDGWLFHIAILEPDVFSSQTFVDVQSKNTKKFKNAKLEFGKVFTMKEKNDAERLADAFYRNEHALQLITDCNFEVPIIGEVQGKPFRGKADVLSSDRIVDLKTTSDIKGFPYAAKKYGYDIQCYLYCCLFNKKFDTFKFLVLDKKSLDIGVWDCSEEFYFAGEEKVEKAIDLYEKFFIEGYDLDNYCLSGLL